jgi:hypothetical protein
MLSLLVLAAPVGWIVWNQAHHNFAVLQPGRIYRSGQMPAPALRRTIQAHGIKTVLNLRGPNPAESWYRQERETTLASGATQIDLPMSSCVWMSRLQLRELIGVLQRCEYPLLIHCAWGSERTGLVSAIAALLRPGSTLQEARDQFSLRFLFVPLGDGKIMSEMLDRYESWLRANRLEHRPETFRTWAIRHYVPGTPNREQWPYDPYPLVVITRPVSGAAPTANQAGPAGGGVTRIGSDRGPVVR